MDSPATPNNDRQSLSRPDSISLFLYAHADDVPLEQPAGQAAAILQSLARNYEILPYRDAALDNGYRSPSASIFRAALGRSRNSMVVFADSAIDLTALRFILPLAEHVPIVAGYRAQGQEDWGRRFRSRLMSGVAQFLLGTRVRDLHSGLVVVRRSDLENLVPNSEDFFANAEFFARARQQELAVAEVPVQLADSGNRMPPYGWRDFFKTLAACLTYWWSKMQFPAALSPATSRISWSQGPVVLGLAAILLFMNLNQQPLLDPIEGRQAEIPREMLAHDDLVVPRLRGVPYYEKPPLQYWLTAAAYTGFGVHPWSARLVPAAAAWLSVFAAYFWSVRHLGPRPAFLAGLVLCLTWGFIFLGRTVLLDSLLAGCVVCGWFTAYQAVCRSSLRWSWWLGSAMICGLGILAKGPVALALSGPPVFVFQFLTVTAARPRWKPWIVYGGVALAVASPWYVIMAIREPPYLEQFLWRSNVMRYVSPFDHEQDWWFYFPVLFTLVFPWSLLWPALAYFLCRRKRDFAALRSPPLGFCTLTVVWCLLFYSISGSKSPPYMTPVVVPLALLVGSFLNALLFGNVSGKIPFLDLAKTILPRWSTLVVLWTTLICVLVTGFLEWQEWGPVLIKVGLVLTAAAAWWFLGRRASPRLTWGFLMAATLLLVGMAVPDLALGYASRHSPREVVQLVGQFRDGTNCPVIAYDRDWLSASVYLHLDEIPNFEKEHGDELLLFLENYKRVLVLVERGRLQDLLDEIRDPFAATVYFPEQNNKVALVVVHNRSKPSTIADDA